MALHDDVALKSLGDGFFSVEIVDNYWIIAGPNGGYLGAILAAAGDIHLSGNGRQLRSITLHFLKPPTIGEVKVHVQTLRSGKSVDFLRLEMEQNEVPVLIATGVWALGSEILNQPRLLMPNVPDPYSCPPAIRLTETPTRLHEQWDIRSVQTDISGGGKHADETVGPELTWWIRPIETTPMSSPLVVAMSDALPPPIFVSSPELRLVPTIDLTVHIRTDLNSLVWDSDSWVLAKFSTKHASEGFLEEDGFLWDQNGYLLGMSRQLAIAR